MNWALERIRGGAILAALAAVLIIGAVVRVETQSTAENPVTPAVQVNLWRITDPADPLIAGKVEPPVFLVEFGFQTSVWPVRDHQIVGLLRQTVALVRREWKIGVPIIGRAFVNDGSGDVLHMFGSGAQGIIWTRSGMSFYW
jgi:hypothetical protein